MERKLDTGSLLGWVFNINCQYLFYKGRLY